MEPGYILILFVIIVAVAAAMLWLATGGSAEIAGGRAALTELQRKVRRDYSQYRAPKKKLYFDDFCFPRTYKVQRQQAFVGDYMKPRGHKELLVFHKIGAGKSCAAIQALLGYIKGARRNRSRSNNTSLPCVVMPAALIPGFRNELRTPCGGYPRAPSAPGTREYRDEIAASDAEIDKDIGIYSYNSFAAAPPRDAPVIVIDEVQNLLGSAGQHWVPDGSFFGQIVKWIDKHPDATVIAMSGTPIFDSPREIYGLARLLRVKSEVITPQNIGRLFAGRVSYFAGAPDFTYPRVRFEITKCKMSTLQSRWYSSEIAMERKAAGLREVEMPSNFYIGSRQRSNIVFPAGLRGEEGLAALTHAKIRTKLEKYSAKYSRLMRRVRKGRLSFVFTSFTGPEGIAAITKCLDAHGYSDFLAAGGGRRRYAVFSGDTSAANKDLIREAFNSSDNDDASRLQIVIGSPAAKEGVSFLRGAELHCMEGYWNWSKLEQIFGRMNRYCSHKRLPARDRELAIYLYAAVRGPTATPEDSIDRYMLALADRKKSECDDYIQALIDSAVDRGLNQIS